MDIDTPSQSPNELPAGLVLYRQTDIFTESSVPAGLLRDHCTKATSTVLAGEARSGLGVNQSQASKFP